ncbi:MAG: YfiR family protein [Polyangiaceae bacterium]
MLRRSFALTLLMMMLLPARSIAQSMQVPSAVQAELTAKVAGYDRNFSARAGDKAVILLVAMPDDAESMRAALELKGALSRLPSVGDLPHEEQIVTFSNAATLADTVRARKAAIVYFGPGFAKQIPAVRDALSSLDVLTVAAVPDYVPPGIVLGFDLVSGRPKLLINIPQARKQHIAFPASVLNLMKVYP